MHKEEEMIGMLKQILGTLDEHTKKLDDHTKKLDDHTKTLDKHTEILGVHSDKLDNHDLAFQDHGRMLKALLSGQDHLKAELDGMKIANAKEFGKINERMDGFEVSVEILRDETWKNKSDIHRIKNTMGMN